MRNIEAPRNILISDLIKFKDSSAASLGLLNLNILTVCAAYTVVNISFLTNLYSEIDEKHCEKHCGTQNYFNWIFNKILW